jgi:replicative DNA helicase
VSGTSNPQAEWAVVGSLLKDPELVGEIIGTQLEPDDFTDAAAKVIYAATLDRYYSSTTVDPLIVGEMVKPELSVIWSLADETQIFQRLQQQLLASGDFSDNTLDHAAIVRRLSTTRQLASVAADILMACQDGKLTPSELGDRMSSEALRITSGTAKRQELMDWLDVGRTYLKRLAYMRRLRASGREYGVYTGLSFVDDWTKGIGPGELCFLAGDAGSGKSALAWEATKGFARRQLIKPPEEQVCTLLLSMEMGEIPTGQRFAQGLTSIDGMRLREGDVTDEEYKRIVQEWASLKGLPLRMNFASNFRLSQMRALIVEGIRRHNVGFVVIDHFRMLDPDKPVENGVREDEVKVRFLKESVAKDLNVAVLCLAHTIKVGRGVEGGARPRLSDLRGSGQISAAADMVAFLHRPYRVAGEHERAEGDVLETDAELVWAKNRFGTESVALFRFDPATMQLGERMARDTL